MNNTRMAVEEYSICFVVKWSGTVWLFHGASSFLVCQVLFWVSEKHHIMKKECKKQGLLYTLPICCAVPGNFCIWSLTEGSKFCVCGCYA